MTKSSKARCVWCGERFEVAGGPGRRPKYCRRSHRQRAYESRSLAQSRGLAADEVLLAGATWAALRDAVYVAETVASDARSDLESSPDATEMAAIVRDLIDAIGDVVVSVGEPKAVGSGT